MRLALTTFLTALAMTAAAPVMAQVPHDLPASCDQAFLDVMEARAWMEGKREMEIAQRLILKPDSVLEYSCFNQRASQLQNANLFSSSGREFSLRILVASALSSYIGDNFGHSYGGGTVSGGSGCSVMNHVWNELRCVNINEDLYMTFADLVATDPRDKPAACDDSLRAAKWTAASLVIAPVPLIPPHNGGVEAVTTYLPQLNPNCSASLPIPTGAMVYNNRTGESYEEAVCTAPGCSFNGSSCE